MENKIFEKVKMFYFMAVAVMLYYFITEQLAVVLYITFRHVFALVLAFSALFMFLCKPDIARGVTVFKDACFYSIPLAVTAMVSLFVWFMETVDIGVISRGLSNAFIFTNMLSSALGTGAMLYIFGKKVYGIILLLF